MASRISPPLEVPSGKNRIAPRSRESTSRSAVYRLIGRKPPAELLQPIRRTRGVATAIEQPLGLVSPKIDGLVTNFYEWHDAGVLNCMKAGSAMHRAVNVVHAFYWGFDDRDISFRLDLFTRAEDDAAAEYCFNIVLRAGRDYLIRVDSGKVALLARDSDPGPYEELPCKGKIAMKKVVELSVPRKAIAFDDQFSASLGVQVIRDGEQTESWPPYDMIKTTMPTRDKATFWHV